MLPLCTEPPRTRANGSCGGARWAHPLPARRAGPVEPKRRNRWRYLHLSWAEAETKKASYAPGRQNMADLYVAGACAVIGRAQRRARAPKPGAARPRPPQGARPPNRPARARAPVRYERYHRKVEVAGCLGRSSRLERTHRPEGVQEEKTPGRRGRSHPAQGVERRGRSAQRGVLTLVRDNSNAQCKRK